MIKSRLVLILTLTSMLFTSGCATVLSGSSQNINIKVVDSDTQEELAGAKCTVTDGIGNIYPLTSNPGMLRVSKNEGPISIRCKKPGYKQLNMGVGDSFNALTIVNVLFWPGFIIDAVSGAYKKYPSHYMISMEKTK